MSDQDSGNSNNSNNNKGSKPSITKPMSVPLREATIPVIVVNGVYYPSQKLRFKLNDPQLNFCIYPSFNQRFLESFSEKSFGIVSKKSDTDDSYYMVGLLVKVID